MPRYYFQVTGTASYIDRDGRELADDQAAWSMAISSTGELLRDLDGGLPDHTDIKTIVTNEGGTALISLRFTAERHLSAEWRRPDQLKLSTAIPT